MQEDIFQVSVFMQYLFHGGIHKYVLSLSVSSVSSVQSVVSNVFAVSCYLNLAPTKEGIFFMC